MVETNEITVNGEAKRILFQSMELIMNNIQANIDHLDKNFKYHGIGSVAAKLTEEILDLKKYLDRGSK